MVCARAFREDAGTRKRSMHGPAESKVRRKGAASFCLLVLAFGGAALAAVAVVVAVMFGCCCSHTKHVFDIPVGRLQQPPIID